MNLELAMHKEILDWFDNNPDVSQIRLTRPIVILIDGALGDQEEFLIQKISNDGVLLNEENNEFPLEDIATIEYAYILDEIADGNIEKIEI